MVVVSELPSVKELDNFAESVESFPVHAKELADLAVAEGFNRRVIDFYRSFPQDQLFTDKDDLVGRSEQVQMMSVEEEDQPWEVTLSPQD